MRLQTYIFRIFLLLGLCCLVVRPAVADVYEVRDDGAMVRLDQPVSLSVSRHKHPIIKIENRGRITEAAQSYQPYVAKAAHRYDVSPALIDAVARVESRYNPNAVSPARAVGIMQLMPGTARQLGVNSSDPEANIRGGTAYLRLLLNRFDGDVIRTIAAYNAGPEAVSRAGGVPNYPETVLYVSRVLDQMAAQVK